jgi:5-methylcytosine-specific restriction endonuclease McrA
MPRLSNLKSPLQLLHRPLGRSVSRLPAGAWNPIRRRVLQAANGLCEECRREQRLSVATDVDHIVPLHLGGSNADANLQALCGPCHRDKTSREAALRTYAAG